MNPRRRAGAIAMLAAALGTGLAACVTAVEKEAVSQDQAKPDLAEASRLNTQLGIDYARQGQDDLALEKLKRALDQDGRNAMAYSAIAFVYARRGDDKSADRNYRRALMLAPGDSVTKNNYGVFLCAHGKPAEADKLFREAIADRNYETPAAAWTNAGVCARKIPDLDAAERNFRAALKVNPNFAEALAQLASVAYQRQDYLHARGFLQRYQQVGRPTPETLLIGVLTERALGDTVASQAYELRLRREFPDSDEASQLPR